MKTSLIVIGVIVLIVLGIPALACLLGPEKHEVDPAIALKDTMAPSPPVVIVEVITRGRGPVPIGGGDLRSSSMDDLGFATVRVVQLTDDRTPVSQIGLRVVPCDSTAIIRGPGYDFRPQLSPKTGTLSFSLVWIDGATDVQEPIYEEFLVYAVDLGGNLSAEADTIWVVDPGRP